jgi:hypothetical protein
MSLQRRLTVALHNERIKKPAHAPVFLRLNF